MLIFRIFVIALVLRIILLTFRDILFSENDQFQVGNSNSNSYHTTSLLINHSVTHLKVFYSVFTSAFTNTIHYHDFEWTGRKGSLRNSIFFLLCTDSWQTKPARKPEAHFKKSSTVRSAKRRLLKGATAIWVFTFIHLTASFNIFNKHLLLRPWNFGEAVEEP